MVVDDLLDEYLTGLDKATVEFAVGRYNKLCDFMEYACIPERFLLSKIDRNKMSKNRTMLNETITKIIDNSQNSVVILPDFIYGGYIAVDVLYTYLLDKLKKDDHIKSVLYIDTNVFMKDLKRFMDKDEFKDVGIMMEYDLDTLFKKIYNADFVIWDRFNTITSNYEMAQLYEILTRRYNHLKGNMFLCGVIDQNEPRKVMKKFNEDMQSILSVNGTVSLMNDKFTIIDYNTDSESSVDNNNNTK